MAVSIYPEYEMIYLGATKCAQTSMFYALGTDDHIGIFGTPLRAGSYPSMKLLSWYIDGWPNYKTCTVIRNPWDRIVSFFYWRSRFTIFKRSKGDSEEFMGWSIREFNKMIRKEHVLWYDPKEPIGIEPQTRYLDVTLDDIDYLLRFEHLDDDFDFMCLDFNISYKTRPINHGPTMNSSGLRPLYRDAYDDDTKGMIADVFADDIKILGYSF